MKILAALYIAGVLTWLICLAIRKADKYFLKGVLYGAIIFVGYVLFILSIFILTDHITWQ